MNSMIAMQLVEGILDAEEQDVIDAMQHLIDTGMIHTLPGRYGRLAQEMIDDGVVDF